MRQIYELIRGLSRSTRLILSGGFLVSIALGLWVQATERNKAYSAFEQLASSVESDVVARFTTTTHALKGAMASMVADRQIGISTSRAQFRAFVEARQVDLDLPGVHGFGFIQPVSRDSLERFIAVEQTDGAPGFAVRQLEDRSHDELYVVKYIEPIARNANAVGLDAGSDPRRRASIEQAIDGGRVAMTEPLELTQDGRDSLGVLLFMPVYRSQTAYAVPELRRISLVGLIVASVITRELLSEVANSASDQLEFELFAGVGPHARTSANRMFDQDDRLTHDNEPARRAVDASDSQFSSIREIQILDRPYTIQFRSTSKFEGMAHPWLAWLAAMAGLLLTGMLARLSHQAQTGIARAELMAESMTMDLERLAMVARRTSDAVVITDAARRITWVNEGFVRVSGFTFDEAIGRKPGELLQFEGTDSATIALMRLALDAGQTFSGELLNRAKDGRVYWIELEIQPIRGEDGTLHGFMAVESDVTLRKNQESELARQRTRLAQILEGTSVGTWEWNIETGETVFNERWAQILGYSLEELVPMTIDTWTRLAHPEDLSHSALALERHFNGETSAYENEARMRHKLGYWVWVLDRGKLFSRSEDGRPRWMAGTYMDITERKHAEAALRASQAFLDQTGRIAGVGGWTLDLASMSTEWTDETCRIHDRPTGYRPTLDEAVAHYPPEARPVISAAVQRCIDQGESFDLELPFITATGRNLWVRAVGKPEREDGKVVRLVGAFQDISARRDLARALERNNALLNTVIENMPCAISVFDANLKLVVANREFGRLLALPPHLAEPGRGSFEAITRHNAARGEYGDVDVDAQVATVVAQAQSTMEPYQIERVGPRGVNLEVRGGPLPGGGFVTTYTDVSARRQAEAVMRVSNERFALASDSAGIGVWEHDLRTNTLVWDDWMYRLFGRERTADVEPHSLWVHNLYPDDRAHCDSDVAQAIDGTKSYDTEFRITWPDGSVRHLKAAALVQRNADGEALRMVGVSFDVTERTRSMEQAKRATREANVALARLQAIYDILPVGITITDPQGHIIDCNPASERLLGITKAEHLERNHDSCNWQVLREDGSLMPSEEFASVRALTEKCAVHDAIMQVVTPDRKVWLSVSAMPAMHSELGVVVGYVDITDLREQQAALVEATALAEQASLAKSQFLANMSHEIRTPMNAILGMLTLLRKTELSTRQSDYAAKTDGAARSLLRLLNDILDFSKVDAGKMELDPQPFSLEELMGDLSVIFASNVGCKRVEVLFDIDAAVPRWVVGDALRLQQVLINLVGNAIKFTAEGEVVMSIRAVGSGLRGQRMAFAVRDTGLGIAPENQSRIFSGFTQAEASTTRRFGGTGLGVAISQRIVALLGGELKLESAIGRGSCFSFEIEMSEADGQADAAAAAQADQAPRHVLVVDDHPGAREVLQRTARTLGWTVETAADGRDAIAQVRAASAAGRRFDAVFVDWMMPGMDGWQTVRALRTSAGNARQTALLMITAQGREELARRGDVDQALIDGYLVKPITAAMLAQALAGASALTAHGGSTEDPGPKPLVGLRLLLVEDNANNQQVARELLEDEGASVELASDGREAVDTVTRSPQSFDLVLMDLQMPVMDGLEATRLIRALPAAVKLPIVAMTANAMASDRAACLAAGMNDHVGKPFDLAQLVSVIRAHVGRDTMSSSAVEEAANRRPERLVAVTSATGGAPQAAAQAAGIELGSALGRLGGRAPVYVRMLRTFVGELEQLPEQLRAAIDVASHDSLRRLLHTVRGVAATLGISSLASALSEAETAVKAAGTQASSAALAGAIGPALDGIAQARDGLARLVVAFEQDAAPASATADAFVPANKMRQDLQHISALLRDSDMSAIEAVAALHHHFASSPPDWLVAIEIAIDEMDFETADAACAAAIEQMRDELASGSAPTASIDAAEVL